LQKRATSILKWFAATVVGLTIILGVYYMTTHPAEVGQEFKLATTKQPEPFTELYFTDPESLPGTIPQAPSELPISFVIHNQESRAMDYTYRVSFKDAQSSVTLPEGKVALQDGQSQSITQHLSVPQGQGRGEISVQIVNKSQQIHYWLERL
jgi:hypothetical protein